jgi:hypothetical protein
MSTAEINAGICGFITKVKAHQNEEGQVELEIESACPAIQKLAAELKSVDPFREISFRRHTPEILEMGARFCSHAACPVPTGIIKAVEVEAQLALPAEVTIRLTRES